MMPVRVQTMRSFRWVCSICGHKGPVLIEDSDDLDDTTRRAVESEAARHARAHLVRP